VAAAAAAAAAATTTMTLHQQIGLTFKEETNKALHLEYNCVVLRLGHC